MVSIKEIDALLASDSKSRYKYTIGKIVDYEEVWVIGDSEGLRSYSDNEGNILFPIWPFKEFASLCCVEEFANCSPEGIELELLLSEYFPDFKMRDYSLAIFPLPNNKGIIMDIDEFKSDI